METLLLGHIGMLIPWLKKSWITKSEIPNSSFNYPKLLLQRHVGLFNHSLGRFWFCDPKHFKSWHYLSLFIPKTICSSDAGKIGSWLNTYNVATYSAWKNLNRNQLCRHLTCVFLVNLFLEVKFDLTEATTIKYLNLNSIRVQKVHNSSYLWLWMFNLRPSFLFNCY